MPRHNKLRHSAIALALVPLTTFATTGVALAQEADTVDLNVLGVTDFHGHLAEVHKDPKKPESPVTEMGAASMACYLDKERAANPNTSFVSAGDNIGGSPFTSAILEDKPTLDVLNAMKLDASAVGNHEFDKGWEDLRDRVGVNGTTGQAQFPYLGANVTGSTLAPSTVVERDGVKIGYVGVITADTASLVSPAGIQGLGFTEPVAAAKAEADRLKSEGEADVVIALAHEGVTGTGFGQNVDAVIAGHTHQTNDDDSTTPPMIQPASYGQLMADIDLKFNKTTHKVEEVSTRNISAQDIATACAGTPNAEVAGIVSAAEDAAKEEGSKVVTTIENSFYRGANASGETGTNRGTESSLNSLLADAALEGVNSQTDLKPDIGIMNAGGVRTDLEKGEVTFAEAFGVQPFSNSMGVVEISGAELKGVMEQQWRKPVGNERPTLILGFSKNVEYSYDPTAEIGSRITHVNINGEKLDESKKYRIAGASFLLNEGDGYTSFGTQSGANKLEDAGIIDVDLFNRYLSENQNVAVRDDQTSVGINVQGELKSGSEITVNLSSLSYTASESKPSKVTVELIGNGAPVSTTVDVDNTITDNQNETGKATAKLTVPAGFKAIRVQTDNGTEFIQPVESEDSPLGSDPLGSDSLGSDSISSAFRNGVLALVFGALGAGAAAAIYNWAVQQGWIRPIQLP